MNVLPPDPRLGKPKRSLPRGSVDCYAHIFDRFERVRGGEGVNAPGFKVILRLLTGREPLFAANAMRLYRFPLWPSARSA